MLELIDEITIGDWFLPAIFNNDETNLNDEEIEQLNKFLYPRFENCTFEVIDEEPNFARDNVTGSMGDVITLNVYKSNKD